MLDSISNHLTWYKIVLSNNKCLRGSNLLISTHHRCKPNNIISVSHRWIRWCLSNSLSPMNNSSNKLSGCLILLSNKSLKWCHSFFSSNNSLSHQVSFHKNRIVYRLLQNYKLKPSKIAPFQSQANQEVATTKVAQEVVQTIELSLTNVQSKQRNSRTHNLQRRYLLAQKTIKLTFLE